MYGWVKYNIQNFRIISGGFSVFCANTYTYTPFACTLLMNHFTHVIHFAVEISLQYFTSNINGVFHKSNQLKNTLFKNTTS